MKHEEREFTPPFLIQMISGEKNKHCDLRPYGSIHKVKKCKDGHMWLDRGIDSIPSHFATKILDEMPVTKKCPSCSCDFPESWPFATYRTISGETKEECSRCYERGHILNPNGFTRDEYRELIRKELQLEMVLQGNQSDNSNSILTKSQV